MPVEKTPVSGRAGDAFEPEPLLDGEKKLDLWPVNQGYSECMKHRRRRYFVAELCLGSWVRAGLLAMALLLGLGPVGLAQTIPPIVIPIVKERVRYYNLSEDGSRITCGIKLYGSFPVYRGRTNLSDYRIFITGVQNPGSWRLDADGRFRFYAYFNGSDGPASSNPDCNHTIGEQLPDWHAEYQPKRPLALKQASD